MSGSIRSSTIASKASRFVQLNAARSPVGATVTSKAGPAEIALHHLGEALVVFNEEDARRPRVSSSRDATAASSPAAPP